jgi:predicted flap endonuclease-1-like 5' DNA nuclease
MSDKKISEGEAVKTDGAVSFMTKLGSIASLDPALVKKLNSLDIMTNVTLLERGAQPEGRDEIAASAGIDQVELLKALYLMDLERVNGVSWTNATLLTAAGVTTVPDLAFRNADDLLPQLKQANTELGLLKRSPTPKVVKGWIEHARELPQVLFFGGNAEVY